MEEKRPKEQEAVGQGPLPPQGNPADSEAGEQVLREDDVGPEDRLDENVDRAEEGAGPGGAA